MEDLDQNTIIYGHNRRNGSMFSGLNTTLEEAWYKQLENQFINLDTLSKTTIWQIFSIYQVTTKNVSNPITFSSDIHFSNFIEKTKQKSIYAFNVNLNSTDKLLTLYTCVNNTSYRVILHAKLIYEKPH